MHLVFRSRDESRKETDAMTGQVQPTLILGIGNLLMGDDGAGIHVARLLTDAKLPKHVTVQEAGTPGWGLVDWIKDWQSVVLVDSAHMGQKPGEWRRFDADEVRLIASQGALSLHESGLADGLALAQALDLLPERITFYGIEPESTAQGMRLSPSVRSSLSGLVGSILDDFALQPEERE
jgi:hydrogenase maturation protease